MTLTKVKAIHLNAENLFLLLDLAERPLPDLADLSEAKWQSYSFSTVKNKPLHKTLHLAKTLKEHCPDVIMLSEVSGLESLENFNTYFLDGAYQPKLIEGNSDRGIDIGYLVHNDFPLQTHLFSHRNKPLGFRYKHEPESTNHYFSRDVSELRVMAADGITPQLIFFLVHLKSKLDPQRIDPYGFLKREAEVKKLCEIVTSTQQKVSPDCGIVVCGDFNGQAELGNCDIEFNALYEGTTLFETFSAQNLSLEDKCTHPIVYETSGTQYLHLDYFLLSENWRHRMLRAGVIRYKNEDGVDLDHPKTLTQKELLPSDHYPIFLELKI